MKSFLCHLPFAKESIILGNRTQDVQKSPLLLLMEENSWHQLRLVVYPIIYRVLYIPGGFPAGFLNHQQHQSDKMLTIAKLAPLRIAHINENPQRPGSSLCPFWDGEFTWPFQRRSTWPTQRLGIKRSRRLNQLGAIFCYVSPQGTPPSFWAKNHFTTKGGFLPPPIWKILGKTRQRMHENVFPQLLQGENSKKWLRTTT